MLNVSLIFTFTWTVPQRRVRSRGWRSRPSKSDEAGGSDDVANNPLKQVAEEMTENQVQMMRLQNQMNRTRMFAHVMTWSHR